MPMFDYYCKCGKKYELLVKRGEEERQRCPECGALMDRQFPGIVNFKLVYNNKTDMCDWKGNTSQYWNDVKKQREKKGKLMMPVTENIA